MRYSGVLVFDSGNMSMQEYEQRYFYIFKMAVVAHNRMTLK